MKKKLSLFLITLLLCLTLTSTVTYARDDDDEECGSFFTLFSKLWARFDKYDDDDGCPPIPCFKVPETPWGPIASIATMFAALLIITKKPQLRLK